MARTDACNTSNLNFSIKANLTWLVTKDSQHSSSFLSCLTPTETWPQLMPMCRSACSCCCLTIAELVHRHFDLSQIPVGSCSTTRYTAECWSTHLQCTDRCTWSRPNKRANSAAWLPDKGAVDAWGPDVTGRDGCLSWGVSWALPSTINCLISRFSFTQEIPDALSDCMQCRITFSLPCWILWRDLLLNYVYQRLLKVLSYPPTQWILVIMMT